MSQKVENLCLSLDVHQKGEGKRDVRVKCNFPIPCILFIRTGKTADHKNCAQIAIINYPNEGDTPQVYDVFCTFEDICKQLRQLAAPESRDKQWILCPYIFSPIGLKLVVRQDVIDNYIESNQGNTLHIHNYDEPLPIITKQEQEDAQHAYAESFVTKGILSMREQAFHFMELGQQWEARQQDIREYNQLKQDVALLKQEMQLLKQEIQKK